MAGPQQFSFANADWSFGHPPDVTQLEFGGREEVAPALVDPPDTYAPQRLVTQAPSVPKAPKSLNVLALAKARLREVKRELRRMRCLEVERDELERLIAAAQPKPTARRLVVTK